MSTRAEQVLPPLFRRGDTLGLIAPGGSCQEKDFRQGLQILEGFDLKVKIPNGLQQQNDYLAGSDRHRLNIIHEMWRDPEVKALMAVRGGFGSLRLLPGLDYNLIRSKPKTLIGFSDLTALHAAIIKKTGLITIHGPMLTTLANSSQQSLASLNQCLCLRQPEAIKPAQLEIIKKGTGRGRLLGGNLTTLNHLLGTPYEPHWHGALLLIEDVGEAPYRIDRLLTHLHLAGCLAQLSGLILGTFNNCGNEEFIWQRVEELCASYSFPIWANFPSGHGHDNLALPLGVDATMDSSQGSLSFNNPCHP